MPIGAAATAISHILSSKEAKKNTRKILEAIRKLEKQKAIPHRKERDKKQISPIEILGTEILSLSDGSPKVKQKLNHMYEIYLMKGRTKEFLNTFGHLGDRCKKYTSSLIDKEADIF